MPVPSIIDDTDWTVREEPVTVESPRPKEGTFETPTSHVVRSTAKELGEGVGRRIEQAVAFVAGESLPKSALRVFVPKEMIDKYFPDIVESGLRKMPFVPRSPLGVVRDLFPKADTKLSELVTGKKATPFTPEMAVEAVDKSPLGPKNLGDIAAQTMSNAKNTTLMGEPVPVEDRWPDRPDVGPAPGYISKNLAKAGRFTAMAVSTPEAIAIPGMTAMKYILGSIGASEFGELGRMGMEAPFKLANAVTPNRISDETIENVGNVGDVAGSMIGAPTNVIRANAVVEAVKKPFQAVGRVTEAAKNAWEIKRANDKVSLFNTFLDQFGGLREESKGTIQKIVNETIANDLRNDMVVNGNMKWKEDVKRFDEAAGKLDIDPTDFTVAQRTNVPSLVATQRDMRPLIPEHSAAISHTDEATAAAVMEASKRIAGKAVKADAPTPLKAVNELQKAENLRLQGLNREAQDVADTTPSLSVSDKTNLGERTKDMYTELHKEARNKRNALYEERNLAGDNNGVMLDITSAADSAKSVLGKPLSEINPETAPQSLRTLKKYVERQKGQPIVTVREWGDLLNQFNSDINALRQGVRRNPGDLASATAARNLAQVESALEKVLEKQAPEIVPLHNVAVKHYREEYAPRFKVGTNANLSRENASGANVGEEFIDPTAIFAPNAKGYFEKPAGTGQISETSMQNFDRLFNGTKHEAEAKDVLWRNIEDQYHSNVLKNGAEKFDPARHRDFMHEYEAPLERVPALREKLNSNANKLLDFQAEGERVKEQFKVLTGSPLSKTFDEQDALKIFSEAMADPRKMGQLIGAYAKNGQKDLAAKAVIKEAFYRAMPWKETANGVEYDPKRLLDLIDAGKVNEAGVGGLQVALRTAFGRAEGDAHLARLRALALIAERQASTNPRFLRPMEPIGDATIKGATGSSGATLLSDAKAFLQGRTGSTYLAAIAAGRYFNNRVKQAFDQATIEALFDPKMSQAILDLAQTPASKKGPFSAMAKVVSSAGKDGEEFLKEMLEKGAIKKHMISGARLSTQYQIDQKEDDDSRRMQVRGVK